MCKKLSAAEAGRRWSVFRADYKHRGRCTATPRGPTLVSQETLLTQFACLQLTRMVNAHMVACRGCLKGDVCLSGGHWLHASGPLCTIFNFFDMVAFTVDFVKLLLFFFFFKGFCVIFQAATVDVFYFPSKTRWPGLTSAGQTTTFRSATNSCEGRLSESA